MQYTPQQSAAIFTRDVSIALAAGAGCGKTFVLTQRFVAELLRDPQPATLREMMAITFTDRAAREMRDRIREAVNHQAAICRDADQLAWNELLQELDAARIQTIHAFCATTLRSHAVELGLDPDFTVLDEATAAAIRSQSIQAALVSLLREQNPDAMEFVLRFGLEGTLSRLRALVNQRFQLLETAQLATDEATLSERWRVYHRDIFLPRQLAEAAGRPSVRDAFALMQTHESSSNGMIQRREILLRLLEQWTRTGTLTHEELQELRGAISLAGVNAKHWSSPEVQEQLKPVFKTLRDGVDQLLKLFELDTDELELAARFGMQALRLTDFAVAQYEQSKSRRSALDFDDLLLKLRMLLDEHPAVLRQLQRSIQFLLLDEFQDTDPVQTQIVQALCGGRLATGGLFLVGDVKQSIYRFRRADPEVFRRLRSQIPEQGQLRLTRNFRSQQEILDFVNFLFAPAMPDEYDALEAFDQGPYPPAAKVEFLFARDLRDVHLSGTTTDSRSEEDESADSATAGAGQDEANDKQSIEQKRTIEAEWIASRVAELLADPTPRIRTRNRVTGATELRPATAGDVVILFRAFSNLNLYEEALRQAGIDYYVVGGRAFFAQQEVYDLVNLCRFLDDDTDEVALIGILRSPLFGWDDDLLLAAAQSGTPFTAGWLQAESVETLTADQVRVARRTREVLTFLLQKRFEWGPGRLLRQAIAVTAYDAALMTEFLGERKLANLQKLLDMADDFERIGLLGLSEFADRLLESISEEAKEELAATHPETGNVVRLMTVHQSKGLEFPVVIVADLNRKQNSNTDAAVLSPQWGPLLSLPTIAGVEHDNPALKMYRVEENQQDAEEAIRLFYVATTRAADYLILSAYWTESEKAVSPAMKLLQERFDLQSGLPQGDPLMGQLQRPGDDWQRIPEIAVVDRPPQVPRGHSQPRHTRLASWPDRLAAAEPLPPEPLALPLVPDRSARERFSVSELEEALAWISRTEQTAPPRASRGRKKKSVPSGSEAETSLPTNGIADRSAERLGNLLHAAMERLPLDQPPDPDIFLQQLVTLGDDYIPAEILSVARSRFVKLLDAPWLDELRTAQQLHREAEFLFRWESPQIARPALIAGTIDCLLQDRGGNWHLIDYKTGHVPQDRDELAEKFGLQMTLYALAIEQLTGTLPASVRIVRLADEPETIEFPAGADVREEFSARLDAAITWLRSNALPVRS